MSNDDISPITFQDVVNVMNAFGIVLIWDKHNPFGSANLNGAHVTFALVAGSLLIIRADVPTESKVADGDPSLFLACNHFNAHVPGIKAAILNRSEYLSIRTECEFITAAGMTTNQFQQAIKESVDNVLAAQPRIMRLAFG